MTRNAVLGGNSISLSGSARLNGGIFAPNADLDLAGSSGIIGYAAAERLTGSGNANVTYVPVTFLIPQEFLTFNTES